MTNEEVDTLNKWQYNPTEEPQQQAPTDDTRKTNK